MTETLVLPLLGLSLWFTWRCLRKATLESFVWVTILWLATISTKQSLVPVAVIAMAWLWINQAGKARKAVVATLIIIAALIPAGLRVWSIIGVWAPLGYGKLNQIYMDSGNESMEIMMTRDGQQLGPWFFTSPSMRTSPLAPLSLWESRRQGVCRFNIDLDNGSRDWDMVMELQKPSLRERLEHQWENVIFLLWGSSWPDSNRDHFWERVANPSRWIWAPLLLIVLTGNGIWLWRSKKWNLMPVLTISGWLFLCGTPLGVAEGRYRKPFEGLLIANALWLAAAPAQVYTGMLKRKTHAES
jgi:hypothetical protein